MSYAIGLILGVIITGTAIGSLLLPTEEGRELGRTAAALMAFWTILLAVST